MNVRAQAYLAGREVARLASTAIPGRRQCPCCGARFAYFLPFRFGPLSASPVMRALGAIGSDTSRFACPACGCTDRERHLWLYFDALSLWDRFPGARVLHVAPEVHLRRKIEALGPKTYLPGDLIPADPSVQPLDITKIDAEDGAFDIVLCNHVLEHVPDDARAMRELRRVLAPGGFAILQTPYSDKLDRSIEDAWISGSDDRTRQLLFGLRDHVRLYGRDLFERLRAAGFALDLRTHADTLGPDTSSRYGVNEREPLVLARAG